MQRGVRGSLWAREKCVCGQGRSVCVQGRSVCVQGGSVCARRQVCVCEKECLCVQGGVKGRACVQGGCVQKGSVCVQRGCLRKGV